MSDGALRISILGDASQFTKTLSQLEAELKSFQDKLKTATGADIPTYNLKIVGAQQSIKEITEFGKFAEGTLGRLIQLQKELEAKRLTISDPSELSQVNQKLAETANLIKEIKATGIEKPISIPIQPPPPGSIADIKKQIAELTKEREIAIGPDLTYANYKINQLKGILDGLLKKGIEIPVDPIPPVLENSIQGIKNQIDELNRKKVLIDIANEGEIAQVNQQLDGLATKLARANSISFDKNGAISANAGKSRQALTSLSLVAQDLPFGFIAIQNNLPAVISSFGALRASAVGTAGVMASLGAALAGPAGLFLAFSVVTGAVTFAVQKYGSLGAAIDALTGKYVDLGGVINRAAESLKEYNENQISTNEILASAEGSQAGQILKVKTLSAVVLDLSKSENVRKKALQELQELDETRFKNFSVEKGLLDGLSDSVKEYTRAIIAQAVAQKFTDQVSTTTVELEKQRNALSDISRQLYKYGNFQERLNKLAQEQSATARQGGIPRSANKEEREIQALVNKRKELQAGFDNLTTQLDEYNLSAQNAIETASSLASGLKKTGDSADDAAKKTNKLKKAVKDLDIAELERQGRIAAFKLEEQAYKNRLKAVEDNIKAEEKLFDQIEKRFESDAADADKLTKKVAPNASIERTTEPLAELQRQFQLAYTAINQTFFEPLQNLFETFLNTGKFTFKEFTKSVLKSITSIVSKIAATGVITALMYLLDPSGMLASFGGSFGGGQGGGNGILSALGSVFGAQPRKPDFNGVRPQGGGRGGEKVEFQIRGTNLVGVLNRANGEINRIG